MIEVCEKLMIFNDYKKHFIKTNKIRHSLATNCKDYSKKDIEFIKFSENNEYKIYSKATRYY